MPQCGFLTLQPLGLRSSQPRECPRMYVATRAGTLALYSLAPGSGRNPEQGAAASGASTGEEWQATLLKEVHACRPFRHFTERRLSAGDLGPPGSTPGQLRAPSPSRSGPMDAPNQRASSRQASPLGPRASPAMGPAGSPRLGPRPASPSLLAPLGLSGIAPEDSLLNGPSKWLSAAETATHVPTEVPIWICPQLSFHAYPAATKRSELKAALRHGRAVTGRRKICISRPERPGDAVRYDGGTPSADGEERLSRLFGGALGAMMDEPPGPCTTTDKAGASEGGEASIPVQSRPQASVVVSEAWGQLHSSKTANGEEKASLLQMDGVGACLEEVEEDWLKA